jgi:P-type E1-E2 ATPase
MISLHVPGIGELNLEHVVFDVNGTLAVDGKLLSGIPDLLQDLKQDLEVHLLTADTHGKQIEIDQQLKLKATRIQSGDEKEQKAAYIHHLGAEKTAAVGQGANDALMLEAARIGICVISAEGTALETLLKADLVVPDIISALEILQNPTRLKASLRN